MRSKYKIYDKQGIYFITSSIIEWIPIFISKSYFDILISSMEYCQENKNLTIYAYVILDNHFHMICHAPELSLTIQSMKRHTAKCIIEQLETDNKTWLLNLLSFYKKKHKKESTHQLWQEGFYPKQIISDESLLQKVEYIHYNPVKRGYVSLPEHWNYSSARNIIINEGGFLNLEKLPV